MFARVCAVSMVASSYHSTAHEMEADFHDSSMFLGTVETEMHLVHRLVLARR